MTQDEERLFGRTFETLDQMRRIEILKAYGLPVEVTELSRIRGTRRSHLHLAQLLDRDRLAADARSMFKDAVYVVAAVIGQKIQDGKLVLTQPMMRYLRRASNEPEP